MPDSASTPTSIFARRVGIVIGLVVATVLGLWFIGSALQVLLLVLAGVLLAVFFRGLGRWLSQHTPLSEGWGALVALLVTVLLLVGIGWFLAPRISQQVTQLGQELPQSIARLKTQVQQYSWGRKLVSEIPSGGDLEEMLLSNKGNWLNRSLGIFSSTLGVLANTYIVLFVAAFFLAQPQPYKQGIILLVPKAHRDRARQVLNQLGRTLFRWVLGKLFSMLVVAILTALGLWLLGMPLALTLALFAGLFSFIPNFGPLIGLAPALLLAFTQGPSMALYVVLLYLGVQLVESNLITPLVQRRMVELPPALVIISQVLMGVFTGGLGLLLATPIVAMVLVLVKMLYIHDVLDDPQPEAEMGKQ